jgi:HAMP domain-containing protein
VQTAALFSVSGKLLTSATGDLGILLLPELPEQAQLKQARTPQGLSGIEGEEETMFLRVLMPVSPREMFEEPRILQLTQASAGESGARCRGRAGGLSRLSGIATGAPGLTRIYALTLTLTVLVALFSAFALAYWMARRLVAPLYILAEGTQAVAQGDFSQRQAVYSGDELGRADPVVQPHDPATRRCPPRDRPPSQRTGIGAGYLESILANLSAGVLVFDRDFRCARSTKGR